MTIRNRAAARKIADALSALLDWVYPRRCAICGDHVEFGRKDRLCPNCEGFLKPIVGETCAKCGAPTDDFDEALITDGICPSCAGKSFFFGKNTALFPYDPTVRELIHRFKYRDKPYYAELFAKLIVNSQNAGLFGQYDALVPVPMFGRKKRKRGYNQAEELAKAISRLTGVPVLTGYLVRRLDTPPQSGLGAAERRKNVENAFKINKTSELKLKTF